MHKFLNCLLPLLALSAASAAPARPLPFVLNVSGERLAVHVPPSAVACLYARVYDARQPGAVGTFTVQTTGGLRRVAYRQVTAVQGPLWMSRDGAWRRVRATGGCLDTLSAARG